ncbi:hypothetical protein NP493_553g02014 [Ridgeia piscesae]|uniref:DNA-dependent protein kinase catalytic subunit CC3 domain-containing protein n=1 Tax=Ridgeia piscesae TaxID=27915 RepID=A0AAD9NSW9_RIDPI|nr:hypothetical protein NP493_553g02014 [Ridgeia piscesae]
MPKEQQKRALDVPFLIFTCVDRYTADQRRAALERVCLSMLRVADTSAVVDFFCDHVNEVMNLIHTQQPRSEMLQVSRLCSFQLMEMLYGRLSKNQVSSKESKVNEVFCQGHVEKGNELTTAITKVAHQVKSEDARGEDVTSELGRQLRCAAYNALGQFLLDNLVDTRRTYKFDIELDAPVARKKFVSIRQEARNQSVTADRDSDASVNYLASQYLADSSLSVDVTRFDFHASTISVSMESDSATSRSQLSSAAVQEQSVAVKEDFVEMDMDELNQHECMATLTALVKHLDHTISPVDSVSVKPLLTDSRTAANVKLFISRLIVNVEEAFRPYARFWLSPLMDVLVTGVAGTDGINYFIVDLVVTLLSWHSVAIPEVRRAAANSLLEFLMRRCHHDTRHVLKNNLEMLKTLVEVWHDRVTPPTGVIYDNFSEKSAKSKRNLTGIQLAAVMLANKINPFYPDTSGDIDKDRFYKQLAMNMTNESKQVYAPTAEVVGMAMAQMAALENERGWLEEFTDNVAKMLQTVKPDKFINCVWGMQRHHAVVVDRFVSRVLFILPQVHGEFKTSCLEIILSRIQHIDNVFTELKSKGFVASLSHRDEATQLVSLRLVQGMLEQLKPPDLLALLSSVTAFISHPSAICRAIMYDILTWIYDNYRTEESDVGLAIMTSVKDTLLQGLSDDDVNNRLTMLNFWSDETRLPSSTFERLTSMLEAMYSPSTENQYLSYASNLLLEMTSKSPDFNQDIFDFPLSECKFQDYPVQSSWRRRHAAMTPHFVATQVSQTQSGVSQDVAMETGHVRATQDVQQFTPTQDVGVARGPYNWLTQSSLDTFADFPTSVSQSQSSLLFTVGKKPAPAGGKRRLKAVGPDFGQGRLGDGGMDGVDSKQVSMEETDILRLKRRFVRDKESTQVHFARRQARLNKQRQELERERKLQRENQVTMYRCYRIGDLPDIQIKHSAIIAPLQALAQRDSPLARLLFSSVFKAIFAKIEEEKTEREAQDMTDTLRHSLNNMLEQSTQYFPPFIGCVLWLCPGKTQYFPPFIGCVLTEGDDAAPSRKRRAGPAVSYDTTNWIELARLCKSLGDYDVPRAIFCRLCKSLGDYDVPRAIFCRLCKSLGDYDVPRAIFCRLCKSLGDYDVPRAIFCRLCKSLGDYDVPRAIFCRLCKSLGDYDVPRAIFCRLCKSLGDYDVPRAIFCRLCKSLGDYDVPRAIFCRLCKSLGDYDVPRAIFCRLCKSLGDYDVPRAIFCRLCKLCKSLGDYDVPRAIFCRLCKSLGDYDVPRAIFCRLCKSLGDYDVPRAIFCRLCKSLGDYDVPRAIFCRLCKSLGDYDVPRAIFCRLCKSLGDYDVPRAIFCRLCKSLGDYDVPRAIFCRLCKSLGDYDVPRAIFCRLCKSLGDYDVPRAIFCRLCKSLGDYDVPRAIFCRLCKSLGDYDVPRAIFCRLCKSLGDYDVPRAIFCRLCKSLGDYDVPRAIFCRLCKSLGDYDTVKSLGDYDVPRAIFCRLCKSLGDYDVPRAIFCRLCKSLGDYDVLRAIFCRLCKSLGDYDVPRAIFCRLCKSLGDYDVPRAIFCRLCKSLGDYDVPRAIFCRLCKSLGDYDVPRAIFCRLCKSLGDYGVPRAIFCRLCKSLGDYDVPRAIFCRLCKSLGDYDVPRAIFCRLCKSLGDYDVPRAIFCRLCKLCKSLGDYDVPRAIFCRLYKSLGDYDVPRAIFCRLCKSLGDYDVPRAIFCRLCKSLGDYDVPRAIFCRLCKSLGDYDVPRAIFCRLCKSLGDYDVPRAIFCRLCKSLGDYDVPRAIFCRLYKSLGDYDVPRAIFCRLCKSLGDYDVPRAIFCRLCKSLGDYGVPRAIFCRLCKSLGDYDVPRAIFCRLCKSLGDYDVPRAIFCRLCKSLGDYDVPRAIFCRLCKSLGDYDVPRAIFCRLCKSLGDYGVPRAIFCRLCKSLGDYDVPRAIFCRLCKSLGDYDVPRAIFCRLCKSLGDYDVPRAIFCRLCKSLGDYDVPRAIFCRLCKSLGDYDVPRAIFCRLCKSLGDYDVPRAIFCRLYKSLGDYDVPRAIFCRLCKSLGDYDVPRAIFCRLSSHWATTRSEGIFCRLCKSLGDYDVRGQSFVDCQVTGRLRRSEGNLL